jgi:hypothetical protein
MVVVPSFFLLGCEKCGTTSLAASLRDAGIQMQSPYEGVLSAEKEWHFFDKYCYHQLMQDPTDLMSRLRGTGGPVHGSFENCDGIKVGLDFRAEYARAQQYECQDFPGTVCDATPNGMRIAGLPTVLDGLYASTIKKLSFVMLLREPFQRMQSEFYYTAVPATSFGLYAKLLTDHLLGDYAAIEEVLLRDSYNASELIKDWDPKQHVAGSSTYGTGGWANWKGGQDSSDTFVKPFQTSMYAVQLRNWLEHPTLSPSQFCVLPSGWAMKHTSTALELMAAQFPSLGLNTTTSSGEDPPEEAKHLLHTDHPSVRVDAGAKYSQSLRVRYFDPSVTALAVVLEQAVARGLTIGGLTETARAKHQQKRNMMSQTVRAAETHSAAEIEKHLNKWWVMDS